MYRFFNIGIINFHPETSFYRGCSAPEWQLLEENEIICTAHFIDEGIDTGEIIEKFLLNQIFHHMKHLGHQYILKFHHVRDFSRKFLMMLDLF